MVPRIRYLMTAEELSLFLQLTPTRLFQEIDTGACPKLPNGSLGIPPAVVRACLARRGLSYAPRIIAHINLKGGTGKTTTTITAATRAAQYGFRTCVLDLDPQGSASLAFNVTPGDGDRIFCDVWEAPAQHIPGALHAVADSLAILPSSLDNEMLNVHLSEPTLQQQAVHDVCAAMFANNFDLILIDCPPSLGTTVISTICAADTVVIPACSDAYSRRGVALTLQEVAAICRAFGIKPPRAHILYTRFDKRLTMSVQVLRIFQRTYKRLCIPTPIRTSSMFAKSLERHATVFASHRKTPAKDDYDAYVRSVLDLDTTVHKGIDNA